MSIPVVLIDQDRDVLLHLAVRLYRKLFEEDYNELVDTAMDFLIFGPAPNFMPLSEQTKSQLVKTIYNFSWTTEQMYSEITKIKKDLVS